MHYLSVCSGVGGFDLGMEAAGHTLGGLIEHDQNCRGVLQRHWPDVRLWRDVRTVRSPGAFDAVIGGTPCQDLSVAGARRGLAGERSSLFWEFCRLAVEAGASWVVWENVPGALSTNGGHDFAAVLWGLTGARPVVPAGGWRTMGYCAGPFRDAAWRVLDAQWFGVPQRRRRVFVVAGPRTERLLALLGESGSVPRRADSGVTPGHRVGSLTANGVGTCGADADQARLGHLVPVRAHNSTNGRPIGVAPTLDQRAQNGPSTTHDVPIIIQAVAENERGEVRFMNVAPSLGEPGGKLGQGNAAVLAEERVRRLTPLECERLMGWPDDHTRYDATGRAVADRWRYRMCGNGVVAPVAEWLGRLLPGAGSGTTS